MVHAGGVCGRRLLRRVVLQTLVVGIEAVPGRRIDRAATVHWDERSDVRVGQQRRGQGHVRHDGEEVDHPEAAFNFHVEHCDEIGLPYARSTEGDQLWFKTGRHAKDVGGREHRQGATEAVSGDQQPLASGAGLGKSGSQTVADRLVDGLKPRVDVAEIRQRLVRLGSGIEVSQPFLEVEGARNATKAVCVCVFWPMSP